MSRVLANLALALVVPPPRARPTTGHATPCAEKRIGLVALALALAVAVSAVTAAAAAASANSEFHAATYPAEWKGTSTNFHGLAAAAW